MNCVCLWNQLEQCGLRTPQCTIQGSIGRPGDDTVLKVSFFNESLTPKNSILNLSYTLVMMNLCMDDKVSWLACYCFCPCYYYVGL